MVAADDQPIGYLTMAPARYVPRLGAFATTPVSPDAAVMMSVRVVEECAGKGIGRQLVQSAAGLVVRRDIRALEAVGTYTRGPSCMLPAGWLEAVGFAVVRPHPITPRLRMDLQSTLRWARPRRRLEPADRPGRPARRRRSRPRTRTRGPLSCYRPIRVRESAGSTRSKRSR